MTAALIVSLLLLGQANRAPAVGPPSRIAGDRRRGRDAADAARSSSPWPAGPTPSSC